MGFKDRKRDDHGHVIGNDERDGQPCQHGAGGSNKLENKQDVEKRKDQIARKIAYGTELTEDDKKFMKDSGMISEDDDFDMDFDEEFNESPTPEEEKQYVDKVMDDIAKAENKHAFEYVSGNIDDLTEAGLISEETADRLYEKLDEKIDELSDNYYREMQKAQEENAMMSEGEPESQDDKDKKERQKVEEMRDEFYAIDDKEQSLIDKEQQQKSAKSNRIQHAVEKAKKLKQEGKSNEIMNLLRGLDDDTASAVIDALMGK